MPDSQARRQARFEHELNRELHRAEMSRRRMIFFTAVAGIVGALLVSAVAINAVIAKRARASVAAASEVLGDGSVPSASGVAAAPAPTASAPVAKPVTQTAPAPKPIAKPALTPAEKPAAKPSAPAIQAVSLKIGEVGYEPDTPTAKAGIPIKLTVGKGEGCAAGFIMPSLKVSLDNSNGPATTKLPALEPGIYKFSCAMEMVEGRLIVQ